MRGVGGLELGQPIVSFVKYVCTFSVSTTIDWPIDGRGNAYPRPQILNRAHYRSDVVISRKMCGPLHVVFPWRMGGSSHVV